ncbi:PD-(D/E)XK nuclease family protein [Corynebacterium mendelii]|uniref:PD-(D/E)XK nuclease family protein n=1 Tax=Corynebacterium mendelii TaxID=2765362 RepID=A0A939ISU9_9CORY|nr:PD-(D/E)XK nuclease family protein [Corynebacterium mendelii]MBN9643159.1 PD-(D/E)XK nuclease family protein [Corynebacterium mendelii]
MKIFFGWNADGAPWSTDASLGKITCGQRQLADLLATRLGLAAACAATPLRIAAWQKAIDYTVNTVNHPHAAWCARSFELDPWSVATTTLKLRDLLVGAGWYPDTTADVGEHSPRIAALTAIEKHLPQALAGQADTGATGEGHDAAADHRPQETTGTIAADPTRTSIVGPADVVRDIDRVLAELVDASVPWDTQIEQLVVGQPIAGLPPIWQRILGNLATLGVPVTEETGPDSIGELTMVKTNTEWEAARLVASHCRRLTDRDGRYWLVAGNATDVLDGALADRGLAATGVRNTSADRAVAQLLPVFIRAVQQPVDPDQLIAFLTLELGTVDIESANGGMTSVALAVVPGQLKRKLLTALHRQRGIDTPAWRDAIAGEIRDSDGTVTGSLWDEATAGLAASLDDLVRKNPLEAIDGSLGKTGGAGAIYRCADINRRLAWLAARLNKLFVSPTSRQAASAVDTAMSVIGMHDTLTAHQLDQIITTVADSLTTPYGLTEASDNAAVCHTPATLGCGSGEVVWWLPQHPPQPVTGRLRTGERALLADRGIHPIDGAIAHTAAIESDLAALRRRGKVTAVLADNFEIANSAPDPLLSYLAMDLKKAAGNTSDFDIYFDSLVHDFTTLPDGRDPVVAEMVSPGDYQQVAPVAVTRREGIAVKQLPAGDRFIPERLSFTQIDTLLSHPLDWLIRYRFGVQSGPVREGNPDLRSIGTLAHAVVERIANNQGVSPDNPVTLTTDAATIAAIFDELVPVYYADFDLPENMVTRESALGFITSSILTLFEAFAATGTRVTGVETHFSTPLTTIDTGTGHQQVSVSGYRDMDVVTPDGIPGVIDLKFARYTGKYKKLISNNQALQLALYSHAVAREHPEVAPAALPTGYFLLKHGEFHSPHPLFDGAPGKGSPDSLLTCARASVTEVLTSLANGYIHDHGAELLSNHLLPDGTVDTGAADALAADFTARGFHIPTSSIRYADTAYLTGITGDFS